MVRRPSGTGASFVPRDVFVNPLRFGNLAKWLSPADGADPRHVDAAQLQHVLMVRLDEYAVEEEVSTAALARSVGMSGDKLYRLKRGETLLPISDMLAFANIVPEVRAGVEWYFSEHRTVVPGERLPDFQRDTETV